MTSGKVLQGSPFQGEIESVGSTMSNFKLAWMDFSEILLFCLNRNFRRISSFSRSHFPFDHRHGSGFRDIQPCLTISDDSIIFSFQCLFSENIFDRVKSNFENIGFADLLFKVSVFVLRCIFGYYSHRSRKLLARNLNIGQYFQYLLLQFWKGTIWNLKFS